MTQALVDLGIDPSRPRTSLLLALGDDALVTGHVASRLALQEPDDPIGPQFARIGTENLENAAHWFRTLAAELDLPEHEVPRAVATIAMGRRADEYTHASSCETRPRSFAHQLSRLWLHEHADALRMVSLTESSDTSIAATALDLLDTKRIHLDHATAWVQAFAEAEGGAEMLLTGLVDEFRAAFEFFEEVVREADAVAEGLLPVPHAVLLQQWLELMVPAMQELGLDAAIPDQLAGPDWSKALELVPTEAGRHGVHGEVWAEQLWLEINQRHPA